jgi:(R,R)-butanediol dehydrogenase/meso-butanediol dehydrogenase/diacetyl reductase/L-iditol 2-dehydrogenase
MKTLCGIRVGNMKDPDPEKRGKVGLLDIPFPEMGPQDVKIKVAYCAICGSDPHCVGGIFGHPQGSTDPIPLGHEISGVVVEVGPKATHKGLKVGDRVAGNFLKFCGTCYYCQNGQQQFCEDSFTYNRPGYAPYLIWHEDQVYKLPDSISLKEGCLLEPMSIVVRMMDKCQVKAGERVCVCGCGPIGLMAIQCLSMCGATSLTAIEPIPERLELAKQMGAVHCINPMEEDVVETAKELTGGRGYDVVLDCSGSTKVVETLLELCAKCGRLVYGAQYPNEYNLPLAINKYLYFNELTLTGVMVAPYCYPRALQMLERMNLKPFTEKVFDLDDGVAAFDAQLSGKYPKIIIKCNPDLE